MAESGAAALLLTSPRASLSVWTTAVKLGAAVCEAGGTVVIVVMDFDLQPNGGVAVRGITDVLERGADLVDVVNWDPPGRLGVIYPGAAPSNRTVASVSSRLAEVTCVGREWNRAPRARSSER